MKKATLFLSLFFVSCMYVKAQDSLQQYVAKYKFPLGSVVSEVDVVLENGNLHVSSSMGSTTIEKTAADQFIMPSYNGTVVFTRNEAKKITGIKIDVMNISLDGNKEEKDNSIINLPTPVYKSTFPIKYLPAMLIQGEED